MIGLFVTLNHEEYFLLIRAGLFVISELIAYVVSRSATVLKNPVVSNAILVSASGIGLSAGVNVEARIDILAFVSNFIPSVRKNSVYPRSNGTSVELVKVIREAYGTGISASASKMLRVSAALSAESNILLNVGIVMIVIIRLNVSANSTGSGYSNTVVTVGSAVHKGCANSLGVAY